MLACMYHDRGCMSDRHPTHPDLFYAYTIIFHAVGHEAGVATSGFYVQLDSYLETHT